MEDALLRAKSYIQAGADGIMIHSKSKSPDEIFSFSKEYQKFDKIVPLVAVPSTYNYMTEKELSDNGIDIVIYANHLLRSAYPSMLSTAEAILMYGRTKEIEENLMSIKEIINFIPTH